MRPSEAPGATIGSPPRVGGHPEEPIPRLTEGCGSCRRLLEIAARFPQPPCKTPPPDPPPRVSHSSHSPGDDDRYTHQTRRKEAQHPPNPVTLN